MKFLPGLSPQTTGQPAYWFAFCGDKLLITHNHNKVEVPYSVDLSSIGISPKKVQYLGTLDGTPCYCAQLTVSIPASSGMDFWGLRQLYGMVEDELFSLAGIARQIVEWDKTHQFCGQCGSPTSNNPEERAKICPRCDLISYPRISPAIIVAITKGEEILLARGNRFATPMYSVIAGFVEAGETLEECVQREVQEEVGLEVKNISYFSSQPWPFPNSLMIGFTAEYAGGEITIDPREIAEAGWFKADALPLIPEKISIARRLIDQYVEKSTIKGEQPCFL
jgi:NAD+ diphosphatase